MDCGLSARSMFIRRSEFTHAPLRRSRSARDFFRQNEAISGRRFEVLGVGEDVAEGGDGFVHLTRSRVDGVEALASVGLGVRSCRETSTGCRAPSPLAIRG